MQGKDSIDSKSDLSTVTKQDDEEWNTISNKHMYIKQSRNPTCEKIKSIERTIKKMKTKA